MGVEGGGVCVCVVCVCGGGWFLSHSAEQKSISLVNKWGVNPLELFVTMCETAATTEYLHLTQQQTHTHTHEPLESERQWTQHTQRSNEDG